MTRMRRRPINTASRRPILPGWLLGGGMVAASLLASGCQKALFPENQPRTQFEAYEIMRQKYVPLDEPDVYGTPRPAIRARLSPEQ